MTCKGSGAGDSGPSRVSVGVAQPSALSRHAALSPNTRGTAPSLLLLLPQAVCTLAANESFPVLGKRSSPVHSSPVLCALAAPRTLEVPALCGSARAAGPQHGRVHMVPWGTGPCRRAPERAHHLCGSQVQLLGAPQRAPRLCVQRKGLSDFPCWWANAARKFRRKPHTGGRSRSLTTEGQALTGGRLRVKPITGGRGPVPRGPRARKPLTGGRGPVPRVPWITARAVGAPKRERAPLTCACSSWVPH